MIDHINSSDTCHVVTVEDPIEFLVRDKRSIVNQRESASTPTRSASPCAAHFAKTLT